jgi:shikimate dehydrogenase
VRRFGLIGYPLTHSFSKSYFSDKFRAEGIKDCIYESFPLENINQFSSLMANFPDLEGLNVTIPYKQEVIPLLNNLSPDAREIGAVNCICIKGNMTTGYNTDAIGFEQSLLPLLKPYHSKALVLGTGGASKAVMHVLKKNSITPHYVSRFKKEGQYTYEELTADILAEHLLIVNTTPVGMSPNTEAAPAIPYSLVTARHLLYDVVYNPSTTLFLQKGIEQKATVKNGHEMLILQAEASWEIWNDQ